MADLKAPNLPQFDLRGSVAALVGASEAQQGAGESVRDFGKYIDAWKQRKAQANTQAAFMDALGAGGGDPASTGGEFVNRINAARQQGIPVDIGMVRKIFSEEIPTLANVQQTIAGIGQTKAETRRNEEMLDYDIADVASQTGYRDALTGSELINQEYLPEKNQTDIASTQSDTAWRQMNTRSIQQQVEDGTLARDRAKQILDFNTFESNLAATNPSAEEYDAAIARYKSVVPYLNDPAAWALTRPGAIEQQAAAYDNAIRTKEAETQLEIMKERMTKPDLIRFDLYNTDGKGTFTGAGARQFAAAERAGHHPQMVILPDGTKVLETSDTPPPVPTAQQTQSLLRTVSPDVYRKLGVGNDVWMGIKWGETSAYQKLDDMPEAFQRLVAVIPELQRVYKHESAARDYLNTFFNRYDMKDRSADEIIGALEGVIRNRNEALFSGNDHGSP